MEFCRKCGSELNENSRFCHICGSPVPCQNGISDKDYPTGTISDEDVSSSAPSTPENQVSQQEVYSGVVHKCPHCGAALEGFTANCPWCGYELRSENPLSSVMELSNKLAVIGLQSIKSSAKKEGAKRSILQELSDSSLSDKSLRESIYDSKATVILSYPIPNTKEEILEFMILASSNVKPESIAHATEGFPDEIEENRNMLVEQNAWLSKMEQAYIKASLSFPTDQVFLQVKQIYDTKKAEISEAKKHRKRRKRRAVLILSLVIICLFVVIVFCGLLSDKNKRIEKDKEIERLNSLVDKIEEDISDRDYSAAKKKAKRIRYNGPNGGNNLEQEWDETRESYIERIERLEEDS